MSLRFDPTCVARRNREESALRVELRYSLEGSKDQTCNAREKTIVRGSTRVGFYLSHTYRRGSAEVHTVRVRDATDVNTHKYS